MRGRLAERKGFNLDGLLLTNLAFADDIVLIAESLEDLEAMAARLSLALWDIGLEISWDKCKWTTNLPAQEQPPTCMVDGMVVSYTPASEGFLFVGCMHTLDGRSAKSAEHRIAAAWRGFFARSDVWATHNASVAARLRVLSSTV